MGRDIQKEPFTAVGIGDMSGDVFGNGMLLSRLTRLLGAFDHRHVFLDPDPDPASSFAERKRLFDLPRSSWADYDPGKISKGGGVWPRTTKEIPLSPQVRRWLGVRHESIDGDGLIRLLLTAEVDLLWNGGIGTYVKASAEKNEDAGDRANDGVRVDATQVRARVLGEGGNLGLTQKGRIEYALGGGRINTDAIDNSAGVDTSDHEVNLKIFMQHLQEQGRVSSLEERDTLLSEVTDEVCDSVLFNNYSQSLSLSLDRVRCQENVEPFLELSDRLVNAGLLDRQSEALAGRKEVLTRGGYGFTRPELAILLAYSKMHLYQALLESSLPDHPGALHLFEQYFPGPVRERFRGELPGHPLVREITATMINNRTVDQAGCAFFHTLSLRTGAPLIDGVGAYLTFDLVLDGEAVRRAVTSLDNRMPAPLQQEILLRLEKALGNLCGWALENGLSLVPEAKAVEDYKVKAERYMKDLAGILPGAEWEGCRALAERYAEGGLPRDLAVRVAGFAYMEDFLPLSTIADRQQSDLASVARVLTEVRQVLGLPGLLEMLGQVPLRDRWDRMANQALRGSLLKAAFRLTEGVFDEGKGNLEAFLGRRRRRYGFYKGLREGVQGVAPSNFHPLSVVARALEGLAGEGG